MSTLTILEYIGGVAGAVAAAYGVIRFIDSRIEKKIGDESVIKKIASRVRPAVIFDENDSILVDQGGMEFLESIHVTHDENDRTPSEIAVVPKKHLVRCQKPADAVISAVETPPACGSSFLDRDRLGLQCSATS